MQRNGGDRFSSAPLLLLLLMRSNRICGSCCYSAAAAMGPITALLLLQSQRASAYVWHTNATHTNTRTNFTAGRLRLCTATATKAIALSAGHNNSQSLIAQTSVHTLLFVRLPCEPLLLHCLSVDCWLGPALAVVHRFGLVMLAITKSVNKVY